MASTSTSTMPSGRKYDVFLSFRGTDTRSNFTSHLYSVLNGKSIKTFRDDKLDRGDEISPALLQTIKDSKISVIVFSKGYANSRWCLEELAEIMECKENMGQKVLPIFYHVDPSDVRKQSGTLGEGFGIVKEKFSHKLDLVQKWSNALTKAANLSGWTSSNCGLESDLIEKVAEHIKKLCPITYTAPSGLVGIDWQFQKIISLLRIDQATYGCYSVGLWGMGGIGKTTTAKCIFREISYKFSRFSFFPDVREQSKLGEEGLIKEFYSKLGFETKDIQTVDVVPTFIGDTLRKEKVLVVLDDVNDPKQLEALLTNVPYGPGSITIVTSRDKQVLKNGVDVIYEMKGLNYSNALQLLSMKAFREMHPPKEYEKLSKRAVKYAGGLPLALQVLGSNLSRKNPEEWEMLFKKLAKSPEAAIQKILKITYDELDPREQSIFLDIACFFQRYRKDWVTDILDDGWVLSRLEDKCLISIDEFKIIRMHDLIEEMGKDIAAREGTRFCDSNKICQLLLTNKGTEAVQGMVFDTRGHKKVHLHPKAFSKMHNLRILKFYDGSPPWYYEEQTVFAIQGVESEDLKYLSNNLIVLHWKDYPYKSLPSSLFIDNLVELNLPESNIIQLWDGEKAPKNLKRLDLGSCRDLKEIPNLSNATKLEVMSVSGCESLIKIHPSISSLEKLIELDVSYCEKLEILPEVPGCVTELYLSCSGVKEWSQSTQALHNLLRFDMSNCKNIESVPWNNIRLPNLFGVQLNLSGCSKIHKLPEMRGNLTEIDLSETAIEELPSSIECLSSLVVLTMKRCRSLDILPHSICKLKSLLILDLRGCSKLGKLPPLNGLSRLRKLYLVETALEEIPDDIVSLSSLRDLFLNNCKKLQHLPKLPEDVVELRVQNCTSLRTVESPLSIMGEVNFCNCEKLGKDARSTILSQPKSHFRYSKHLFNYPFSLGIPGSAIPKWLKHQRQGSSFSTQLHALPPFFVFSVIIGLDSRFCKTISLKCKCSCLENTIGDSFECRMVISDSVKSDHMFLWYRFSKLSVLFDSIGDIETSFKFKARIIKSEDDDDDDDDDDEDGGGGGDDALKIKECGVHLLYYDDDDDDALLPSTSFYINTNKRSRENEEEEPQSQRTKDLLYTMAHSENNTDSASSSSSIINTNNKRSRENEEEEPHLEITKDLPYKMAQLKIDDGEKKYFDSVSIVNYFLTLHITDYIEQGNDMDTKNKSRENDEEKPPPQGTGNENAALVPSGFSNMAEWGSSLSLG